MQKNQSSSLTAFLLTIGFFIAMGCDVKPVFENKLTHSVAAEKLLTLKNQAQPQQPSAATVTKDSVTPIPTPWSQPELKCSHLEMFGMGSGDYCDERGKFSKNELLLQAKAANAWAGKRIHRKCKTLTDCTLVQLGFRKCIKVMASISTRSLPEFNQIAPPSRTMRSGCPAEGLGAFYGGSEEFSSACIRELCAVKEVLLKTQVWGKKIR